MPHHSPFRVAVEVVKYLSGVPPTAGVNVIQVTVSYPYQSMTPWLSSLDATITETATYIN